MKLLLTSAGIKTTSIRAACAIDDETAIRVVDRAVDVVSDGQWKRFTLP